MKNVKRTNSLISGIYCIINLVNSKIYIGSSKCIYNRIRGHLSTLRNSRHGNSYLQRSFGKHGEDNFYSIILEHCEIDELITREEYWIKLLDADYNIVKSNLTKPILSLSEDSRKSMSDKIKEYHKNGLFDNKKKDIHVYKLDGTYISSFTSYKDCCESLGFNNRGLFDVFSGITNHYKGYQFSTEYLESMSSITIISHTTRRRQEQSNRMSGTSYHLGRKHKKESSELRKKTLELIESGAKIIQYDKDMIYIKEWSSVKDICLSIGCCAATIKRNLRGDTDSTKYGIWKWNEVVNNVVETSHAEVN